MSTQDLSVLAPAAFSLAFDALARHFVGDTKCKVHLIYGPASGDAADTITSRLASAEPADFVVLPGAMLDEQLKLGRVRTGSRVDLMRSSIGICARAGAVVPDVRTVKTLTQALLDAPSVAYSAAGSGAYVSNVLFKRLGIEHQMLPKGRRVFSEPVAAVVARGDAALGFQQISELLQIEAITLVGPLPEDVQHYTVIGCGLPTGSRHIVEAKRLIEFLKSPRAAATMVQTGVEPIATS